MSDGMERGRMILCLFTRYPEAGKVKTRLIPSLGADGAAMLYGEMAEHALNVLRSAARVLRARVEVRFTGADERSMREWLGGGVSYVPQGDGDLGACMARAMEQGFSAGADCVLIVGGDCPDMEVGHLLRARALLEHHKCVLGPAMDGGYYLVGLTEPIRGIFDGVDWGTDRVFEQTVSRLDAAQRNHAGSRSAYAMLPVLSDVDRPEDVPPVISVIVPALNEERFIGRVVENVLSSFKTECLVVDGGSSDGTREAAERAGARVLSCLPGRARQMNHGARDASGGVLLFLHADSGLPPGWAREIRQALRQEPRALGAFPFRLDDSSRKARCVEWGVRLRCRLCGLPYGDQGFFMTRALFERLGGFPEQPILEDVALVRRAKAAGSRVCFTESPLLTSARRWRRLGYARTVFLNHCVLLADRMGVPLEHIRDCYVRGKNPLRALLPGIRREAPFS